MSRQLRSRVSRPNYAAMFSPQDDDGTGLSQAELDELAGSGSDFAPDEDAEGEVVEEDENDDLNEELIEDEKDEMRLISDSERDIFESIAPVPSSRRRNAPATKGKKRESLAPAMSRTAPRQHFALPSMPSMHHRHRAMAIYHRAAPVERLLKPPRPFAADVTVPTNSGTKDPNITTRVNKAWGYSVGPGPLWEMMEDRGWYKEERKGEGEETEGNRRPRVHGSVKFEDIDFLTSQEAAPYLPQDDPVAGGSKPGSSVPCTFGLYGQQTRIELSTLDTLKLADLIPGSMSHVFNAGASVWALDWCPIHPHDRQRYDYKQFLVVAPFPFKSHSPSIGVRASRPAHACIQLWSLGCSAEAMEVDSEKEESNGEDPGEMKCEMILCVESGPAFELKWCPLPSNDPAVEPDTPSQGSRKLGLLGGTFEDGSFSLYAVPDPAGLGSTTTDCPIYVKLEPLLRIELEETCCWALDWADSEVIAIGCTNGSIAVFNIAQALQGRTEDILPTHYFSIHQSAIRTLAWVRVPGGEGGPTVIASGGYDGVERLSDIRDLAGNVLNRTRDVINSLCYSTYAAGPITIDHENIIKAYSASPAMLGRGHILLGPDGPAWSIAASDYHPQLAVGATDGSCLTTNTSRATRRGGSVPFLVHKIFQLDYSRKTGEYRMLEKFLPTEMQDRPSATRASKSIPVGTGAWSPEAAVQRVVWNSGNGLGRSPFLASATGSGLCRVDYLWGKWMKDRIPYDGIQGIRQETDVADEDEESD